MAFDRRPTNNDIHLDDANYRYILLPARIEFRLYYARIRTIVVVFIASIVGLRTVEFRLSCSLYTHKRDTRLRTYRDSTDGEGLTDRR